MKLGIFADSIWGLNFIKKISTDRKYKICFVVGRTKKDQKIFKFCKKKKIKFHIFKNVNSDTSFKTISSYKCDILVSMSYDQIFKKKILKLNKFGIINCHAGLLPSYRGRNVLNWVLINGERFFGITVHKVDEYIDNGEIIFQKKFRIFNKDNYKTLLNKCYVECPKILIKALKIISGNTNPITDNRGISPSYYKKRKRGDEIIDWNQNFEQIKCFVKALVYPGPYACFKYNNKNFKVSDVKVFRYKVDKNISNGTILNLYKNKLIIKCNNAEIKVNIVN